MRDTDLVYRTKSLVESVYWVATAHDVESRYLVYLTFHKLFLAPFCHSRSLMPLFYLFTVNISSPFLWYQVGINFDLLRTIPGKKFSQQLPVKARRDWASIKIDRGRRHPQGRAHSSS